MASILGNVSYAVYMYQYLAIGTMLYAFRKAGLVLASPGLGLALHVASQLLTLGLASFSYQYIERLFYGSRRG